jgi:hypothetical protein
MSEERFMLISLQQDFLIFIETIKKTETQNILFSVV